MNIGIDIDDVITDTYDICMAYGQKYTIEDLKKSGNIKKIDVLTHLYVQAMHSWTEEEQKQYWNKYYETMMKDVRIKIFAKEYIHRLHQNNKIILITARWENEKCNISEITKEWLKENEVEYDELVINSQNKLKVAEKYKIDLFIDDSFKNCVDVANGGIKTFLMDSRTNQSYRDERITRVYSWPHIYQEYEKIVKGD